jgi:hypothetical protein
VRQCYLLSGFGFTPLVSGFEVGMWLYRRISYNARLYFLAHFDWSVIKDSFYFGVFEMLGSVACGVGQSVEIIISQIYLVNSAEVWGN